jgi:uncharacterized membrane protein
MWMAALALIGLFIAAYLTLYHYGYIGTLSCSATHGCETVQTSKWSKLLGVPVAAWGLGYYAVVFALTVVGVSDRFSESRSMSLALVLVTGWGALFSGWLTYLEGFAIHAWCQWCLASATIALILFAVSLLDWRREGRFQHERPPAGDPATSR